jgi:hypothetical protein
VSKTGRAILEILEANPTGLSRYQIVKQIPEYADETVRRMVSVLTVRDHIIGDIDSAGVVRYVISDKGREELRKPKPEKQIQAAADGWVPGPWVHPITRKMQGKIRRYHSTDRRIDLPPDPTTQQRPTYPPRKPATFTPTDPFHAPS